MAAFIALFWFAGVSNVAARDAKISIIIDDMGNHRELGLEAVALPGPVACAFLPHTRHAAELAARAHLDGKEVMLHIPMQARKGNRLGPGGVTASMDRIALMRVVSAALRSIPHVSGVSNHMGSLLTSRTESMGWLMDLLRVRGDLFFVDSRTTRQSRALEVAQQRGVPSTWRDVFLDHHLEEAAITRAFHRLLTIARRRGTAVAVAHPHEETLKVLAEQIPRLREHGVQLVPVAALIEARESERPPHPATTNYRAHTGGAGVIDFRAYVSDPRYSSSSLGQAAITR